MSKNLPNKLVLATRFMVRTPPTVHHHLWRVRQKLLPIQSLDAALTCLLQACKYIGLGNWAKIKHISDVLPTA